jgi:hypothetical protein
MNHERPRTPGMRLPRHAWPHRTGHLYRLLREIAELLLSCLLKRTALGSVFGASLFVTGGLAWQLPCQPVLVAQSWLLRFGVMEVRPSKGGICRRCP